MKALIKNLKKLVNDENFLLVSLRLLIFSNIINFIMPIIERQDLICAFFIPFICLGFFSNKILLKKWFWLISSSVSLYNVYAGFPYTSNLYFLLFYINLLVLIFLLLGEDHLSSFKKQIRLIVGIVFFVAVIQKIFSPEMMSGSFYYQSFFQTVYSGMWAPFAETFLWVKNATIQAANNNAETVSQVILAKDNQTIVNIDLPENVFFKNLSLLMVYGTIIVEGSVAITFLWKNKICDKLRDYSFALFLFPSYWIAALAYDFGLCLCILGFMQAKKENRIIYLVLFANQLLIAFVRIPQFFKFWNLFNSIL